MVNGYAEGIALDISGHVSEGSGENIFLVKDGTVFTPPISAGALPGITRNTMMTLCRDLGIPVAEQVDSARMLYISDEAFLLRHCRRNHSHPLRRSHQNRHRHPRPDHQRLQEEFFALTSGEKTDRHNWLSP